MAPLITAWADFVIAKRLYVIVASFVLLLGALLTPDTIPFDNSTERFFVADDPALTDYDRLIELFGDNEYLIVGIEAAADSNDIFTADTLRDIAAISDFLDFHEYVTQLRSLTNFQYIHADGDDLSTDYLIDDLEQLLSDPDSIAELKSTLAQEELALDTLITRDFRHTVIAARVMYEGETSENKIKLVNDLNNFIEEQNIGSDNYHIHISGYALLQERFETVSAEDSALLIPLMIVLMIVILICSFRSIVATIFPWVVIACGLLIVLELQGYLGIPHTTIDSNALAPTLIIIGIGIVIHVLVEFFHNINLGSSSEQAARTTIIHIWRPAFFTAITTSAGFLSLTATKILPIREFAVLGAIGPLVLFLFSLTVLPAMLSYVKKISPKTGDVLDDGIITRITQKVPDFTLRYRNRILVFASIALAFSIWNIPNIRIDSNYIHLFKENSEARQNLMYFDDVYRGAMNLDIILDSGEVDGIKQPEFLQQLVEIQSWLNARDKLGSVNSLADYLQEINQALNADDPSYFRIPDSQEMSAQFLLLYDSSGANEDLSDIKDFDNRYTRLVVPVVNLPASELQAELDVITAHFNQNYPQLQPAITGTMALLTVQDMYISEGMARSFIIALSVITAFFIILFRSFKYGILSIIPSVLPIILAGSIAGWLGILMDQAAVIVFAMTMGIAVDDAIHVMSRYLLAKKTGASTRQCIERAMIESGRAVVFSSIVLVFGFSVLCFASFTTIIYVGMFGAIIMSLALIGDLVVLPAILYLIDGSEDPIIEADSAANP